MRDASHFYTSAKIYHHATLLQELNLHLPFCNSTSWPGWIPYCWDAAIVQCSVEDKSSSNRIFLLHFLLCHFFLRTDIMEKLTLPIDPIDNEVKKDALADSPVIELGAASIDPDIERRVVRKCDLRVMPPVFCLFLITFWDRINIGNAAIQGLPEELHLVGSQFNVATMILFVPFILLEIPSNIALKKTKPYLWLPFLMLGCGTSTPHQSTLLSHS